MKFFFVLGNHPALSVAELESFFGASVGSGIGFDLLGHAAVADLNLSEQVVAKAIKKLGGTIKIGKILDYAPDAINILNGAAAFVIKKALAKGGKFNFGVSVYGLHGKNKKDAEARKLGVELKNILRENGINARFVRGQHGALSSVQVEKNGLVPSPDRRGSGAEIVVIHKNTDASANNGSNSVLIGVSIAVQPFEEFSLLDYGRPARNAKSGMLPPKLARMMLNIALPPSRAALQGKNKGKNADASILDPFAGSGTILTEAALLGWKNIFGSDISAGALESAQKNFDWIAAQKNRRHSGSGPDEHSKLTLKKTDARYAHAAFPEKRFSAIITEAYLGKPLKGWESEIEIKKQAQELRALYIESLKSFAKILAPGGKIVIAVPEFFSKLRQIKTLHIDDIKNAGFSIAREEMKYFREGQRLSRVIWVLKQARFQFP